MSEQDRRQYQRIGLDAKISYKIVTDADSYGPVKNISRGGICFYAQEKIDLGRLLYLEIEIPAESPEGFSRIEGLGEVMWQEFKDGNYLTGIKFVKA